MMQGCYGQDRSLSKILLQELNGLDRANVVWHRMVTQRAIVQRPRAANIPSPAGVVPYVFLITCESCVVAFRLICHNTA